jgi:putative hydrolase of the HAD superfamily
MTRPVRTVQAETLKSLGFDIEPDALTMPIIAGDEFFYSENARLPVSRRSEEDRAKFWSQYEVIVLQEAGITPTRELVGSMLGEMKTLNTIWFCIKMLFPP